MKVTVAKTCSDCGELKPLDEFPRNRAHSDGYHNLCKPCNRVRSRARYQAKRQEYIDRANRWREENHERSNWILRRSQMRQRAKRFGVAIIEDVDPLVVFERDGGLCQLCGQPVDQTDFEVDHIEPVELGGEHSYANTRLTHTSCNRARARQTVLESKRRKEAQPNG